MNAPTLPNADSEPVPGPNPNTGIGANNPPPFDQEQVDGLTKTADAFLKACDIWRKTDVTSETLAGQLGDQITGLRANKKAVDEARKAAKKPHDDAGKAVQAAFTPLLDRYDRALKIMLAKASAWSEKLEAEARAKKQAEREEAERKEAEARRMAMDAETSGSIDDQLAAEKAQKEAEKAQKAAAKDVKVNIKSASGAGRTVSTRTRNVVTIENLNLVFMHYRDDPKVHDLLVSLATAEANAKGFAGKIPGCEVKPEKYAV